MSYQLRMGQITRDKKLDRTIYFDPRSKDYPIRQAIGDNPLRSYTWSVPTILDQGEEGACVGFAWSHELAGRPVKVKDISNDSARRVYKEAQKVDEWTGEDYEGTSVIAGAKAVQSLGLIKEYRWAFSLNDVILAVGYQGPGIFGTNWYQGMFNTDTKGFIHPSGKWAGGHAIVVVGVSIKNEFFLLANSWGSSWGMNGMCKLSFDDFDKLLKEQGDFCIPVGRSK